MTVPKVETAPPAPKLPAELIQVFEKVPTNYPGMIAALSSEDDFNATVAKWQKVGVLYAADIIRNAPNQGAINYTAKVAINNL